MALDIFFINPAGQKCSFSCSTNQNEDLSYTLWLRTGTVADGPDPDSPATPVRIIEYLNVTGGIHSVKMHFTLGDTGDPLDCHQPRFVINRHIKTKVLTFRGHDGRNYSVDISLQHQNQGYWIFEANPI